MVIFYPTLGPLVVTVGNMKPSLITSPTLQVSPNLEVVYLQDCLLRGTSLRATSHTRLRARDHYTSSTLIGGKGGAGLSSPQTTLEGPMEHVNARWM